MLQMEIQRTMKTNYLKLYMLRVTGKSI